MEACCLRHHQEQEGEGRHLDAAGGRRGAGTDEHQRGDHEERRFVHAADVVDGAVASSINGLRVLLLLLGLLVVSLLGCPSLGSSSVTTSGREP